MPILNKSTLFFSALIVLASMAAGCQQTSTNQTATSKGNKTNAPIKKNCDLPPPTMSSATTTNASGQVVSASRSKIATAEEAIPKIWAEARKWSADATLSSVDGYYGQGTSLTPTDPKFRSHAASERGAVWAWSGTFYSPSKKQNIYLSYIDGQTGGSLPNNLSDDEFKTYTSGKPSIYADMSDMISSCRVYEIAQENGFDNKANYPIFLAVDYRSRTKYPGRKTWVLEERSRTDNDNGKEIQGKVIATYLIDGQTGELLEKREGRVYQF
ncbi:MAG: hypothetical protein PHC53_05520 [Patescibacteria group bacterium]|nr:hypothetical protein [Patescibacteria group bacterium]